MKNLFTHIKVSLLFYIGVFGIQLFFYFAVPSFYISSPEEMEIPWFIKMGFAKYFGLVFGMYLAWGIILGLFNHILLTLSRIPSVISWKNIFYLNLAQFLTFFFFLFWIFPSVLNHYPLFRSLPLLISYSLLLLGVVGAAWLFFGSPPRIGKRAWLAFILALGIPTVFYYFLTQPESLDLPPVSASPQEIPESVLIIGFDALDGDSGNQAIQKQLVHRGGALYTNAFTPLPLTHPAWNSILTGLYPENHQVRYFFDSPWTAKYPDLFLPKILKQKGGFQTLFASDQPETSYFTREDAFDQTVLPAIGWEAHMVGLIANHFILPGIWLNNAWVENFMGISFNYASLFNYDVHRFFNNSLEKFSGLKNRKRFLALHTCFLHTPVRLQRNELKGTENYLLLSPRLFNFWKWPLPGKPQKATPAQWVNPYYTRRTSLQKFLVRFIDQLKEKGYLDNSIVVLLSDHGERFVKDREVYGGVHGVDLKTREQNNVVLTILHPKLENFTVIEKPVSLIDVTPTLVSVLGFNPFALPFDGTPLMDLEGSFKTIPSRPLLAESMGYIDDKQEKIKFPQIDIKTLEQSLIYHPNGAVTIGEEYYHRIIKKKEYADFSQIPEILKFSAHPNPLPAGAPSL